MPKKPLLSLSLGAALRDGKKETQKHLRRVVAAFPSNFDSTDRPIPAVTFDWPQQLAIALVGGQMTAQSFDALAANDFVARESDGLLMEEMTVLKTTVVRLLQVEQSRSSTSRREK